MTHASGNRESSNRSDHSWILDVLGDLLSYSKENGMEDIYCVLLVTLQDTSQLLQKHSPGKDPLEDQEQLNLAPRSPMS